MCTWVGCYNFRYPNFHQMHSIYSTNYDNKFITTHNYLMILNRTNSKSEIICTKDFFTVHGNTNVYFQVIANIFVFVFKSNLRALNKYALTNIHSYSLIFFDSCFIINDADFLIMCTFCRRHVCCLINYLNDWVVIVVWIGVSNFQSFVP